MSTYTGTEDANAVLDWTLDWTAWLADTADTITAATVTVDTGLTKQSSSNTTTTVTAWLTGGTLATAYKVVYHITTAGGRQDERTLLITVRDR